MEGPGALAATVLAVAFLVSGASLSCHSFQHFLTQGQRSTSTFFRWT
jgi:hypothetical protein